MLKLYVDDITKKHLDILIPFIGLNEKDPNDPINGRYDKWLKVGSKIIEIVNNITDCHYVLFNQDPMKQNDDIIQLAKKNNKKILVLFNSDYADDINIQNSIILRTSLMKSNQKNNEYALPAFVDDILLKYFHNEIPLKNKNPRPIISFCGYNNFYSRQKAINNLKNSQLIISNFIIRDSFWGGTTNGPLMKPEAKKVRKELIDNLNQGDYALCVRGTGNFSYRFYEAMSMGKIPVFVNTDCVLPFDWLIDWKNILVWVEENDLDKIDEIILEHHNSISNEDFLGKQITCRNIWKQYLSPEGYYSEIFNSLGMATP